LINIVQIDALWFASIFVSIFCKIMFFDKSPAGMWNCVLPLCDPTRTLFSDLVNFFQVVPPACLLIVIFDKGRFAMRALSRWPFGSRWMTTATLKSPHHVPYTSPCPRLLLPHVSCEYLFSSRPNTTIHPGYWIGTAQEVGSIWLGYWWAQDHIYKSCLAFTLSVISSLDALVSSMQNWPLVIQQLLRIGYWKCWTFCWLESSCSIVKLCFSSLWSSKLALQGSCGFFSSGATYLPTTSSSSFLAMRASPCSVHFSCHAFPVSTVAYRLRK